jgi:hypothetical protein
MGRVQFTELELDKGKYNKNLKESIARLNRIKPYEDLSTIIVCPTRGMIHHQVVEALMHLMRPVNQPSRGPIFVVGKEVGEAYNEIIEKILTDPYLCQFKYLLTVEDDNIPPTEGLLKLYESMDKYDVVGGLYWAKEEYGFPIMFGNPDSAKREFRPQVPVEGEVVEVAAMGMGFTLFKLDIFRNVDYPWFQTIQEYTPEMGSILRGQDLYFYNKAASKGYKFAIDCSVLVGHLDINTGIVW